MELNVSPGAKLYCHAKVDADNHLNLQLTNTIPEGYSLPEHELVCQLYLTSVNRVDMRQRTIIRRVMELGIDRMIAERKDPLPEAG